MAIPRTQMKATKRATLLTRVSQQTIFLLIRLLLKICCHFGQNNNVVYSVAFPVASMRARALINHVRAALRKKNCIRHKISEFATTERVISN